MEWFWAMVDHLQKSVAGTAVGSFAPIDWVVFLMILWSLVQGGRKGFSDMFGKLLGIFLVSMLTLNFYKAGAEHLVAQISVLSMSFAEPVAFYLIAILLWISVSWCINAFGKFFKVEAQGLLKTLGGMVFGVLRMMLLLSFLAQLILFLPIEPVQQMFKQGRTYTGYTISRLVPDLYKLMVMPFRKSVPQKVAASVKVGG
jgi:uncharacterized membrane protein required for colicin V production